MCLLLAGCQQKTQPSHPQDAKEAETNPQSAWVELYSSGRTLFERGDDLSAALQKADQGFRETNTKDQGWNWKFRVLKAEVLLWSSHSRDALELLAVPPPPALLTGEFAVRAKMLQGLGLNQLGRLSEADQSLQEAENIARTTAPEMLSNVALFKGLVAQKKNNLDDAQRQYLKALQLARQYQIPFVESSALSNSAMIFTKKNQFDQAIDGFSESMSFAHKHNYQQQEQISASNLGWSYVELGDLNKAIASYSQEEKVIEQIGIPQLKSDVYSNLGQAHFAQGNYSLASEYFRKAYSVASEIQRNGNSNQNISIADDLDALANVDLEQGRVNDAEIHSKQAWNFHPNSSNLVLTSAKIDIAKREFVSAERRLKQIIDDTQAPASVRWYAQAELANVDIATNHQEDAERQFQNMIASFYKARSSIKDEENRLAFSLRGARVYDDYIGLLVDQHRKVAALQLAELNRSRMLSEGLGLANGRRSARIQLSTLQNMLKQNQHVILAYRLAAKRAYLWAITSTEFQLYTLPVSRKEIEREVDTYKKVLVGPEDVDEGADMGRALYQTLIQPAEQLIPKGSKVLLLPDGALYRLNFETLIVPGPSPHYWIDDVEIENVSSLQLLTHNGGKQSIRFDNLLLMGAPVPTDGYPLLAHATEEMDLVAKYFRNTGSTRISGTDATPLAYQGSRPGRFDVIHFVAHGISSETSPLESAIILSPQSLNPFKLYARSIIDTPLHADLVTISACSGAGTRDYSGEGLVGLAWSFLRAGAHHVVAGLWDVDDVVEPELMDRFYSKMHNDNTPAAALRAAKLAMLHSDSVYRKPYYWASLQLYTGS